MDAKLFRLPTQPNFFAEIGRADPFDASQRQKFSQLPAQSIRFPGYAAPMSDARLVTSYQNHCSQNIPTGRQFATKEWMTHNAVDIIGITRDRAAKQTGAIYGLDKTVVPPPVGYVNCTRSDCTRTATNAPGGIGMEREPSEVPELFGTWESSSLLGPQKPNTGLTTFYEGGINTPRGNVDKNTTHVELR